MLIPRKEKGQREIYKCKLGIHDWVTEHWWETRQKPNSVFKMVDLNQEVEIYLTNLVSTVYFMSIILVNPGRFLKRNLGFLIQLLLVL